MRAYSLVDFGHGRKLERFGPYLLDRPAPAADGFELADPAAWSKADARFDRTGGERGAWNFANILPERWTIGLGALECELKLTPFGHVGLFPEQTANWNWIAEQVRAAARPVRVLHLFAYTGASTLAAAAAGAEVTHVDAAANVVAWARRNAELSRLAAAPVRWIAEDAPTFVRRELRRGRSYDALIFDPPSYGHGPSGQVWKIETDLEPLLGACVELLAGQAKFVLLSCHSDGFGPQRLADLLDQHLGARAEASEMALTDVAGRSLACGGMARWAWQPAPADV